MNPIQAMASAITSTKPEFLEIMKHECTRKAHTSRNAGFKRFWTEKANEFSNRLLEIQGTQK